VAVEDSAEHEASVVASHRDQVEDQSELQAVSKRAFCQAQKVEGQKTHYDRVNPSQGKGRNADRHPEGSRTVHVILDFSVVNWNPCRDLLNLSKCELDEEITHEHVGRTQHVKHDHTIVAVVKSERCCPNSMEDSRVKEGLESGHEDHRSDNQRLTIGIGDASVRQKSDLFSLRYFTH